jgi:exodeoxyribonuclease VII large subunit
MIGSRAVIIGASMVQKQTKIYTVSQLNSLIKTVLEENLPPRLTVAGEISDWKHHSSGHCYFALKDAGGLLPCVMWAANFKRVKFSPENGMAVLVTGFIDVYEPQGKYQFYVEKMQPEGVGALQIAFERMVRRLEAEGLFAEEHKKAIPPYPMRIGILTSESGAAVRDIEESIRVRWPCAKLFLYPVPVQGEGAAERIAAAITNVNRRNRDLRLDVLIVGRGGGSMEDLWAFNEEILARALFASKIPVISAVGHEIDTTIADLVADRRASTPTKAGVAAVPDIGEVLDHLAHFANRLLTKAKWGLQVNSGQLNALLASAVFRLPFLQIRNRGQLLDELQNEVEKNMRDLMASIQLRLSASYEKVIGIEPHRLLGKKALELNVLASRVNTGMTTLLNHSQMQLTACANRLGALNPKSVLLRGFSIATNKKTGRIVVKPQDVEVGDFIVTELADENLIESQVTKK